MTFSSKPELFIDAEDEHFKSRWFFLVPLNVTPVEVKVEFTYLLASAVWLDLRVRQDALVQLNCELLPSGEESSVEAQLRLQRWPIITQVSLV